MLSGQLSQNYIGNSIVLAEDAPIILPNGYTIPIGGQFYQPINMDGYKNIKKMLVFGLPVNWIKSNFNLTASFNYNQQPSLIINQKNMSDNYITSLGAFVGSNISDKLDFTLSYNGSYNTVKNSIQINGNNYYLNYQSKLRFEWNIWNDIVLRSDGFYTQY